MNSHYGKRKRNTPVDGKSYNFEGGVSQEAPKSSPFTAHETRLLTDQPLQAARVKKYVQEEGTPCGGLIARPHSGRSKGGEDTVWLDRFDARLLLTARQSAPTTSVLAYDWRKDVTWDDLPSDTEDTFFLSGEEVEQHRRRKQLDIMEQNRQARIRQRETEDKQNGSYKLDDSEEEPDEEQLALMVRTSAHIRSSPNPALLEMKILANHGSDPRFAFLRGRWKRRWQILMAPPKVKERTSSLVGYGSDGDEGGKSEGGEKDAGEGSGITEKLGHADADATRQEAKRRRLAEWTRKRREGQALDNSKIGSNVLEPE